MGFKIKDLTKRSPSVEPAMVLSSKEQFLFWVEEHRGLVWGGILLVLVVIAATVGFVMHSSQKQEQAWELEGKAQGMYLDRPLDDVKQGKENVVKASGMFQEIVDQYPGTTSAQVSLFLLGNSLVEQEKYSEGIAIYNQFIQKYGQDHILVALVQQRLGLTQLLAGDQEAAKSTFQMVLDNPHALNKDQVTFELAKLAESGEKIDVAVGHYKTLIQDYPLSPYSTEANLRLKVLAPEEAEKTEKAEEAAPAEDSAETEGSAGEEEKAGEDKAESE